MREQQPLADQRIIVIDDERPIWKQLKLYIDSMDDKLLKHNGIRSINVEFADSVVQAEELFNKAADPFDLAVLDLRLPINSGATNPMMQNGFNLLKSIQKERRAKGVVVISNYGDYTNVRKAFTGGAIDFINKPLDKSNVEPAVINALVRSLTQDAERLLNERVFQLVAHAQLGLAHGFRQIFFTLLKGVTEAADGLEKDVRERYGVDNTKGSHDALPRLLSMHQEAIVKARQDWAEIQGELAPASSEFESRNVSEMLHSIKKRLEPPLVIKRVNVTQAESYNRLVHTFEKDVEIVLGEIIAGSLPSDSKGGEINISFVTEPTRVGVVFEDDFPPIPETHAKAINAGLRLISDANFGRAWGLSVAQHVALRGGGELNVAIKHGKNVVTYYIPLADHA